jgi:hypothetical protein
MNQKGYINIIFATLIIVLVGIVGYLLLTKKSEAPLNSNQSVSNQVPVENVSTTQTLPATPSAGTPSYEPQTVNWEKLLPDIKAALQQAFPKEFFYDQNIKIESVGDVTGDGVPEALVQTDCGGTTCRLALMQIENNKPTVAKFQQKNGAVSYLMFSYGSGGSGRYGSGTNLDSKNNAVEFDHYSAYNANDDVCSGEIYQWNPQSQIFVLNSDLTNKATQNYCSQVCSTVDPGLKPYFQRICH